MKENYTNSLINETSPYLLQHAHNPVNWLPWGDEAFEKAKKENKLVIISIGYSACHWCHVMEHQSFEDESVAKLMNEHYVCIKVDREERPDVDQIYMLAVQLMSGHGGWPLNCFTLPDGRPIYGGTYFPKDQWTNVLNTLHDLYTNEPDKVIGYAEQLTDGINKAELILVNYNYKDFSFSYLHKCIDSWVKRFDTTEGGPNRAPKFPLPNNYLFLLRYAHLCNTYPKKTAESENNLAEEVEKHVHLTLQKMAFGGIYDQLGGGFARYSTDMLWKVPHFEKMLYDNAQLVSLYSEAFHKTKDPLYEQVIRETLDFIERELTSPEGCFYSALDADTDGEEGKYYVWKVEELKPILQNEYELFAEYYSINAYGYWEHDNYVLMRHKPHHEIAQHFKLSDDALTKKINSFKQKLLSVRNERTKPALDDKTLTSWNALMIKGYADAYVALGDESYLKAAIYCAEFILKKQKRNDGGLNHSYKNGRSTINGYLEDYSFVIDALIKLYQCTFDEKWLHEAKHFSEYCIKNFFDERSGMFYFTSAKDKPLIARKHELSDNVMPASNSVMALNLFYLSKYYGEERYINISKQMLKNVEAELMQYGSGYSNWGNLLLNFVFPFYELVITGISQNKTNKLMHSHYLPQVLLAGGERNISELPILENRFHNSSTKFYVCTNNSCKAPVENIEDALHEIMNFV